MLRIGLFVVLFLTASRAVAETKTRVVLYDGVATEVAAAPDASKDLWLSPADLAKATKFTLKPEGVCTAKLCYPIPAAREKEFLARHGNENWLNFSEFARLLQMPAATDAKNDVWFFGPRSEEQNGYLKTLLAPDFTLNDVEGKSHSLRDFRGKKVLVITWASW